MKDLSTIYSGFAAEWFRQKRREGVSFEEMEQLHSELYDQWMESKSEALGGMTPAEYVKKCSSGELMDALLKGRAGKSEPPFVITNELSSRKDLEGRLVSELAASAGDGKFFAVLGEILMTMDSAGGYRVFIDTVFDPAADNEARSFAAEKLSQEIEEYASALIKRLPGADQSSLVFAADALYSYRHPRVRDLIMGLFFSEGNAPLYCAYLIKQGDGSVVSDLVDFSDTCGYLDYIEVRNVIEYLGGEMRGERNFAADPDYIRLTTSKQGG